MAFSVAPREAEGMFVAVRVDANRGDEEHIFIAVNAVDLDRRQAGFPSMPSCGRRQRHEAAERSPTSTGPLRRKPERHPRATELNA